MAGWGWGWERFPENREEECRAIVGGPFRAEEWLTRDDTSAAHSYRFRQRRKTPVLEAGE